MNQPEFDCDLLVIGGGINGAGIAADAAGRGLRVVLCEKSDLAAGTSWASTKLIHGGLRYLENYEFALVRKSLQEREVLAAVAPHLIRPLAIQIPQLPHSRNALMIRAGLFLYDFLAHRRLFKASRAVTLGTDSPLNPAIRKGFEYWDGFGDDARLVVMNALQARRHGAEILTRTECTALTPTVAGWQATLTSAGQSRSVQCRAVVNAAGPWVDRLLERFALQQSALPLRLVKGSHIIVPRLYAGEQAYLLQHHDGRVIFVIPYLHDFTLIGTTEVEYQGELDDVGISGDEINYLINMVNLYFKQPIEPADVKFTYAGVRPLIDEAGESATRVSRDYQLKLEAVSQPLLTIYGGKITTYRILAEEAVDKLVDIFPAMKPAWTRNASLPGGDFDNFEALYRQFTARFPWLDTELRARWLRQYGTLAFNLPGAARNTDELGIHFGQGLYQCEVDYLCEQEWARNAEDILLRRTKLLYWFDAGQQQALTDYLHNRNR